MNEIKIQVAGENGSGKSTIASLLDEYLTLHGFNTSLNDEDSEYLNVWSLAENLHELRKAGTRIAIETINVNREAQSGDKE